LIRKLQTTVFCVVWALAAGRTALADGLPRNWPMAPIELEHHLEKEQFTILEVKGAGGGVTGASKLKIALPGVPEVKVKWKAVPQKSLDGWNNSPRKELASYEVQKWFLDENDYVVPTAAPYCIPLDAYKSISPEPIPSIKGSSCVLGIVALWLSDVDAPVRFWNPERFQSDALFARNMADFNLLTYLVDHRDGRQGNLLVSTDAADPRVFAVDNGISFEGFPWNFFVTNWNKIRVPWLNRKSVDRLRSVDKAKLDRLGTIVELASDKDGVLHVVPSGPNMNPKKGVRQNAGRVQFGLSSKEIRELDERRRELLDDVDKGRMKVR
jgi:hypothetical protein